MPQEITATVDLYEIPFVPILEKERRDWSMFRDFLVKERVLEPVRFIDQAAQSPGQRSYRTRREADREAAEAPGRDFWKSLPPMSEWWPKPKAP